MRIAGALAESAPRRGPVILVSSACLALVSGCAHYTAERLVPAQTANRLDSRTLTDPALRAFIERNLGHTLPAWPLKSWDLQLLTLVAFYYSPTLDVARTRWSAANAAIITAGARPNPTLALVPAYSTNPPVGIGHGMPTIEFDVPIETAGKRAYRILEARHAAEAARWNVISTAWQVRRRLTGALLDYAVARHRTGLLESELQLQEQALQRSEGELAAGAVAGSDLTAARVQVAKTRLDLETARADVIQARASCAEALGVPLRAMEATALRYEFDPANASALTSEEARRRALQGRSDVLAALAEYEAAQAALQ
ncbi:MAG: TolC family protein, partial [Steroidobacteraceae bacterium]